MTQSVPDTVLTADRDAAFAAAADALKSAGATDKLFDLRMLHAKVKLGLSVARPETISDVPREHRPTIEEAYREAGREAGQALLDSGDIPAAWSYFQAIGETGPIREAIDAVPLPKPDAEYDESLQELSQLALYEGAHPRRGVELMLATVGTCSTITALDQILPNLPPEDRRSTAAVLVRSLHADLFKNLTTDVERTAPLLKPPKTIAELLTGRETMLEGGSYHIDVSHLSSVVRFARNLDNGDDELPLAVDLCAYGRLLDPSLQYDGEPPFEEFYVAHAHFLRALSGDEVDEAVAYFQKKLDDEPDEPDQRLIAYVLSDLLMRCGRTEEAVELAATHLAETGPQTGFSLTEMCQNAGRMDLLTKYATERGDLVGVLAGRFGA